MSFSLIGLWSVALQPWDKMWPAYPYLPVWSPNYKRFHRPNRSSKQTTRNWTFSKCFQALSLVLMLSGPVLSYIHRVSFDLKIARKCSSAYKYVPKNYFCMQKVKNHPEKIQMPCHEQGRPRSIKVLWEVMCKVCSRM